MTECSNVAAPLPSGLGSRTSVLNRTMILSKQNRRPGLPEASPTAEIVSPSGVKIGQIGGEQSLRQVGTPKTPNGPQNLLNLNSPKTAAPPPVPAHQQQQPILTPVAITRPSPLAPALLQILAEASIDHEAGAPILDAAKAKHNEWAVALEKSEKGALMLSVKLQNANKVCEKATKLFRICDEHGIDLETLLTGKPQAILQLRQRQQAIGNLLSPIGTPTTDTNRQSPSSDFEDGLQIGKLAQEREALQAEVHSLEENYSNLFKLYEKMRLNCANLKDTEQQLRTELEQMDQKYNGLHAKYVELLYEAQKKLDGAQAEVRRMEKEHDEKTLGIRLALKRAQIQNESLEITLESKTRESEELHRICNELIEARDRTTPDEVGSAKSDNVKENALPNA